MAVDWDALVVGPNIAVFGETKPDGTNTPVYLPVAGVPFFVNGVFDNPVGDITINDPTSPIYVNKPVLGCSMSDFPVEPDEDDKVFIPKINTTFVVKAVTEDSHGGVLLELLFQEQNAPGYWPPGAPPNPALST